MYLSKQPPLIHQQAAFDRHKDDEYFALFWHPGLGKSKGLIDQAIYLFAMGRINALVVLTPNGTQYKWLTSDFAKDWPERQLDYKAAIWRSGSAPALRACDALLMPGTYLRVMIANIEALVSPTFVKFLDRFLNATESLVVVDESQSIAESTTARSKALAKSRRLMPYRRVMSGTAASQSPLKLFGQMSFLHPDILGTSKLAFVNEYAKCLPPSNLLVRSLMDKQKGKKFVPAVVATDDWGRPIYKNLDKLRETIDPYCSIVRKEDVRDINFPETIIVEYNHPLEGEQKRIYNDLKRELFTCIGDDEVTITRKVTLVLRLQQVACGFVTADGHNEPRQLFGRPQDNPRIQLLLETLEEMPDRVVIFCKFRQDIENIAAVLPPDKTVFVHGGIEDFARAEAVKRFQSGDAIYIVGTIAAMHRGFDLQCTDQQVFYSNGFSSDHRQQALGRIHRIGSKGEFCRYVDFVALNDGMPTVDGHITHCLRHNLEVEEYLMRTNPLYLGEQPKALDSLESLI